MFQITRVFQIWLLYGKCNMKVFLHERKRHTARAVQPFWFHAVEGYPLFCPRGREYPLFYPRWGDTPCPVPKFGHPSELGVPLAGPGTGLWAEPVTGLGFSLPGPEAGKGLGMRSPSPLWTGTYLWKHYLSHHSDACIGCTDCYVLKRL